MNTVRSLTMAFACAATLGLTSHAFGADGPTNDPAKAQYDAERARCMSGTTGQTQDSCLRSAGAAYQAARQGTLNNPDTGYRANSMSRCAALSGSDRTACEARVDAGTSTDAVKAGGDVKQTIQPVPAGSVSR